MGREYHNGFCSVRSLEIGLREKSSRHHDFHFSNLCGPLSGFQGRDSNLAIVVSFSLTVFLLSGSPGRGTKLSMLRLHDFIYCIEAVSDLRPRRLYRIVISRSVLSCSRSLGPRLRRED